MDPLISSFAKAIENEAAVSSKGLDFDQAKLSDTQTFIFILNKKAQGVRAHYLSLHPHKGYLLPHIQHITWPKIKGWNDYRTVVYKNELYFLGGKDRETGRYSSKLQKYDPAEDRWTVLSNMMHARCHFTATVVDKRILVIGGETSDGQPTDIVESYEPHIDLWTVEGKLPEPRKFHSTTLVGNKLFITGGQSADHVYNNNLWELSREFRLAGERANFVYEWSNVWDQIFTRKIQQITTIEAKNKLMCFGGLVQGVTTDGKKLADEPDIDEANSESDADFDEEGKERVGAARNRRLLPASQESGEFIPTYKKLMEGRKKKTPQQLIKTTRRVMSIDVTNDYLRTKNPYKAFNIEQRMIQPRAGATSIQIGRRVYVFGGYSLETERTYVPMVEYYHIRKERWYPAFNLTSSDGECFRDLEVQALEIPRANPNFKILSLAYKYPMW